VVALLVNNLIRGALAMMFTTAQTRGLRLVRNRTAEQRALDR